MRQVVKGPLNERGRSKNGRIDVETLQARPQCLQSGFHIASHFKRVAPRILFDDQQQARFVVDDRVPDGSRKRLDDLRYITQSDRSTAPKFDDRFREVCRRADSRNLPQRQSLIRRIDKPAAVECHRISDGSLDGIERHAMRLQPIRIDENLELPVALPPNGDVRHTGDRHQSRSNRPLGQDRHLHLRQRRR